MSYKSNWTREEIRAIHDSPLLDLVYRAATTTRTYHPANQVQVCSLISIKTGGCPEDCKYCPHSSRYQTNVTATPMMQEQEIIEQAQHAISRGATRVCLGAAWRSVRDHSQFEVILRVIQQMNALGVEVCCTLGMLSREQAVRLKKSGRYAYNHNLDTSPEYYSSIVSTRRYEDRLQTLDAVESAGISVCCGGIIGRYPR